MNIKLKKIHKDAVIPYKKYQTDVGLDLTAISKKIVDEGRHGYIEYSTGLALEIPEGYGGFIFPRSSISDTGHILSNSVGLIDPGYKGEITLRFKTIKDTKEYKIGDRIGQLVIMPFIPVEFEEVEELSDSERGEGGYGSTNK